jgi:hypothetical protein
MRMPILLPFRVVRTLASSLPAGCRGRSPPFEYRYGPAPESQHLFPRVQLTFAQITFLISITCTPNFVMMMHGGMDYCSAGSSEGA